MQTTTEREMVQTTIDETTKKKIRRRALLDQILADAKSDSAQYVQGYDVGRGAE